MPGVLDGADRERAARLAESWRALRGAIARKVVGQEAVLEQLVSAVLCGGHCLLVGVPGLAKTLLVRCVAEALSLRFSRVQFTPDLMPSDITGTEVITELAGTRERVLRFVPGPVFTHLLLADEINRTPPKTQAALLEAMEERQVTVAGRRHPLEEPFLVLATQNPIEQEGTYPLPAAQLDRFLYLVRVEYPAVEEELEVVRLTTSGYRSEVGSLLGRDEVLALQGLVRRVPVADEVVRYATALVRATRVREPGAAPFAAEWLAWGAGPRAPQALLAGARARALLRERGEASAEDVRALLAPVLRHRLVLNYRAEAEGMDADRLVERLLDHVQSPDGWRPTEPPRPAWWRRLKARRDGSRETTAFTRAGRAGPSPRG